jgi:hypothetical protein
VNIVTDLLNATSVEKTYVIGKPVETDWEKIEPSAVYKITWEISAENSVDGFLKLPENALAAQEMFKKEK